MKKVICFFLFLSSFIGCDKGCTDTKACNYGITTEDCKYADSEEQLLMGSWNLVDVHDDMGVCIFSSSNQYNCELDLVLQWINIAFNSDKSCIVMSGIGNGSDPAPVGDWSINICTNTLNFSSNNAGFNPYLYPNYLPFGNQHIIELSSSVFMCEDLAGNILRWEKI